MPYLKCVPCRIRLDRSGPEANLFDGGCPVCGVRLQPAPDLEALIGYQAFDLARGESAFAVDCDRATSVIPAAHEALAPWAPPAR